MLMSSLGVFVQRLQPVREGFYWFVFFCGLWWLLTAGQGWVFGVAFALLASLLCGWLGQRFWRLRLYYLPRFVFFFLRELLAAGWDVGHRAFDPRLPIAPGWVDYPLQQTNPRVSLLLSAMVGLLPGTLASQVGTGHLTIHVLNKDQDWQHTVARLEQELTALLEGRD